MGKDVEVRGFFTAVSHALRYFNMEATWHQNTAAHYLRLNDSPHKQAIWDLYHEKMVTRIDTFYLGVISVIVGHLDYFTEDGTAQKRNDLEWLKQDRSIAPLIDMLTEDLDTKLRIAWDFIKQARDIFADQATGTELEALPLVATMSLSARARRMGKAQYSRLAPDDPRRAVADCWAGILRGDDRLRNPAPGTPEAGDNGVLSAIVANVGQQVELQRQTMENIFPDPPSTGRQTPGTGLVNQPPPPTSKYSLPAQMLHVSILILISHRCTTIRGHTESRP